LSKWAFWKRVMDTEPTAPLSRFDACPTCGRYDEKGSRQTTLSEFADIVGGRQSKLEEYE